MEKWGGSLPIITDLVDPRPRRLVKVLNDYTLLSETASFSVGYAEVARGASAVPKAHVQLNRLSHKILKLPIDVLVEPDDQGFLARTPDLPLYGYGEDRIEAIDMLKRETLYGYGEDRIEAIDMLKREIESLFDELLESDRVIILVKNGLVSRVSYQKESWVDTRHEEQQFFHARCEAML
jgi:hypothetical protein